MFQPGLEHEHAPQVGSPIRLPGEMLAPFASDEVRIEESLVFQRFLVQQRLGPFFQRTAEPCIDWHTEPHLGPVDQRGGYITGEHLPEDPLSSPIANFHRDRELPGKLGYTMV